jgi:hypothetical protein
MRVVTSSVTTNPLTLGTTVVGQVSEPGEYDYFTFTGTAGQRLVYDALQSNPERIFVVLYNPAGAAVHLNGDADTDLAPFTLASSGTYRILFYGLGDAVGSYGFRLLDVANHPALPLDTILTNTFAAYEAAIYRVEGLAGQRLYFDALGTPGTGGWYFYAPGDQYLDGSGGLSFDFDYDLSTGGRHVLVLYSGSPGSITNRFRVISLGDDFSVSANTPPTLAVIPEQVAGEEALLTFTATATDPNPADTLRFSLDPGAPAGATINPVSGVFSWTPPFTGFSGFTNLTVRVTDDGLPNLSHARIVTIKIIAGPIITGITKTANSATVIWRTAPGERYRLQSRNTLTGGSWIDVTGNDIVATGFSASETDSNLGAGNERYYRVVFFPKP